MKLRRLARLLAGLVFFLSATSNATAQSVVDPHLVEFDPSPDHALVLPTGELAVQTYQVEFFLAGAGSPFQTLDVGKPAIDTDGKMRVTFLPSWPSSGMTYELSVAAVGPGGVASSVHSNPFTFSGSCNYALNSSAASVASSGGQGAISVLTGTSCTWTASSNASWVTVPTGQLTGASAFNYTVAPNSTGASRTAVISVAGQATFTLTQSAACTTSVSIASLSVPAAGQGGAIPVSAPAGCTWSVTSPASWFTSTPSSGSGSASINYMVAANTSTTARNTTLNVGGSSIVVSQAAATQTCAPTLSASAVTASAAGGVGTVGVTVAVGCAWLASSQASWLAVSPASGSGGGTVSYSTQANTGSSPRSTTLTIAGKIVPVTQAGLSCAATVSASAFSVPASGAATGVGFAIATGCGWTASSPVSWLTVSPASGSGSGEVDFTVQPNAGATARTTTLTVAGLPVVVTQAGVSCAPTVSSSAVSAPASGTSGSVGVTAASGCAWTASSAAGWVSVSPASGSGAGSVSYSVQPNTASTSRSATLTVAGQLVQVTQAGVLCAPMVSSSAVSAPVSGGSGSVGVTAASGCAWTASSAAGWVTVSPASGSGTGAVSYSVQPNTASTSRSATFTVAGKPVQVTQAGLACAPTVAVSALNAPASGGGGTLGVTAASGCGWTSSSPVSWVGLSPSAGSGSATVNYIVQANTLSTTRSATLIVAGKPLLITQAAAPVSTICSVGLSGSTFELSPTGGIVNVSLTASAPLCTWTAKVSDPWVVIESMPSGTGNGTVMLVVLKNSLTTARSTTATIAGQSVTINQQGSSTTVTPTCTPSLSATGTTVASAGQTGAVSISLGEGCGWTATSPVSWITLNPRSGSGAGTVTYQVAANTALLSRQAQLSVAGKPFTITQGPACIVTVPSSVNVPRVGGAVSFTVTTGSACVWTATTQSSWMTVTAPTGTLAGTGQVKVTVSPNSKSDDARQGAMVVAGKTVVIKQR